VNQALRGPLIGLLLVVAGLAGCVATLDDVQAARGTGTSRTYAKPYAEVWAVVLETINSSGLNLVSADRATGRILAQRPPTAFGWGENVALFVDGAQSARTRVEIVGKAALAGSAAANWERRLFEALDRRL